MKRIIKFLKETRQEIRKVTWPTRSETYRYAIIVIVASALVSLYLGGIDLIIRNLMERII